VTRYVDFGTSDRRFWLIDTFEGIPLEQASPSERNLAQSKNERHYFDCSVEVKAHFASMTNVEVVKGRVPDVLSLLAIDRVAYLHIDMNIAAPEVAAAEHFWDRLVRGAVVVFDDYASLAHVEQKVALDHFARARGVSILTLPTGQGLLIRP
jgi:O-methyltransferase